MKMKKMMLEQAMVTGLIFYRKLKVKLDQARQGN
jgi:hypothetical protein